MSKTDDKLIGWLHRMAKLSHSDLAARFDEANRDSLAQLVSRCVPTQSVPGDLAPEEFAEWVHGLRDSARDWNRALGSALLKAEDTHAGGDQSAAIELLEQFAAQCPWLPLKEIAEGEARRHGGGG